MPLGMRRILFGALGRCYPKADWAPRVFRAKSTFESLARNTVDAYLHSMSIIREPMRQQLVFRCASIGPGRLSRERSVRALRSNAAERMILWH